MTVANLERLCRPWCVWSVEEGGLNYQYRENGRHYRLSFQQWGEGGQTIDADLKLRL